LTIKHLQTDAPSPFHPQLQGGHTPALLQPGPPQNLSLEGIHQGPAGSVLGMKDPTVAVSRFQGGAQAGGGAIKFHSQLEQPLHTRGCLADEQLDGLGIAEACSGGKGVEDMAGQAVIGAGDGRDPPLGPTAGGGRTAVLAEKEHPQTRRQLQTGHQPRGPAADHHDIPLREQRWGWTGPLNRAAGALPRRRGCHRIISKKPPDGGRLGE
jgi:hypothetical protein